MSEKQINIVLTPHQANGLAIAVKLVKDILDQPPNTPVYPNLGNFKLERELIKAEILAIQDTLLKQLEEQMPKK
jgi:hypothetical protein